MIIKVNKINKHIRKKYNGKEVAYLHSYQSRSMLSVVSILFVIPEKCDSSLSYTITCHDFSSHSESAPRCWLTIFLLLALAPTTLAEDGSEAIKMIIRKRRK